MAHVVGFEQTAHLDGSGRGVAAVAVGQQHGVAADGLAHGWDERVGAPGPLVFIVPADLAHTDLKGAVSRYGSRRAARRFASASGVIVAAHARA